MIPMPMRTSPMIAAVIASLCALATGWIVHVAHPEPLTFVDTADYLVTGRTIFHADNPILDIARPPMTGLVMRAASSAEIYTWIQTLIFALNIGLICILGAQIFKNTTKGLSLALIMLFIEILTVRSLFANLYLLSDALYAQLLLCGILLSLLGHGRQSFWLFMTGIIMLGCAMATRSTGAMPFAWILLIPLLVPKTNRRTFLDAMTCIIILIAPIAAWRIHNTLLYERSTPNPYVSRHLATHVPDLLEEDDILFTDPQVNADFHATVETRALPPGYISPAPFADRPVTSERGALMAFYGSMTPSFERYGADVMKQDPVSYVFETTDIATQTTLRLIRLHPVKFAMSVADRYVRYFYPASTTSFAVMLPADGWMKYVLQLWPGSMRIAIIVTILVHCCGVLGLLLWIRTKGPMRLLGISMTLLFMTVSLHAFAMAVINVTAQARYALSGSMSQHLLLLLSAYACMRILRGKKVKTSNRRLHILAGNTTYNRGDRINLTAQVAMIRERLPEYEISVSSFDPELDQPWYDAICIRRGHMFLSLAEIRAIRSSDIVVWGGGALMADNAGILTPPYWLIVITFIRKMLRRPVMAWAHGIVLKTAWGEFCARLTFAQMEKITVRDEGSREQLPAGITAEKTADPGIAFIPGDAEVGAHILRRNGVNVNERPIAIIAPTFWPFYHQTSSLLPHVGTASVRRPHARVQDFLNGLASVANDLTSKGMQVVLLPHYPRMPWSDTAHLRTLTSMAREPRHIHVIEGDGYSPKDCAAVWHHATFVLCLSYHDAILSAITRTPCLQLFYEEKGRYLFNALKMENAMMDWQTLFTDEGRKTIASRIDSLIDRPVIADETAMNDMQKHARRNTDILASLLQAN